MLAKQYIFVSKNSPAEKNSVGSAKSQKNEENLMSKTFTEAAAGRCFSFATRHACVHVPGSKLTARQIAAKISKNEDEKAEEVLLDLEYDSIVNIPNIHLEGIGEFSTEIFRFIRYTQI